jgi:hypothetical protein
MKLEIPYIDRVPAIMVKALPDELLVETIKTVTRLACSAQAAMGCEKQWPVAIEDADEPMVAWAIANRKNFSYVFDLFIDARGEYWYRWGKEDTRMDAFFATAKEAVNIDIPVWVPVAWMTHMPPEYGPDTSPSAVWRERLKKQYNEGHAYTWTRRPIPEWILG